jgi:PAS domain S-box-containing protein
MVIGFGPLSLANNIPSSFRALLEEIPAPAFLFDRAEHRVVGANREFCRLCGYSEDELLDLSPDLLKPEYVQPAEQAMQADIPSEGTMEWCFKKKDGSSPILQCKYRVNHIVDLKSQVREIHFTIVLQTSAEELFSV